MASHARDAPTRTLDLITGDPDPHDWWQVSGGWNALDLPAAFPIYVVLVLGDLLVVWDEVS